MNNEKRLWIIEARDGAWGANGICKGELVRCKDCKWYYALKENGNPQGYGFCIIDEPKKHSDDWFCADGDKEQEDE